MSDFLNEKELNHLHKTRKIHLCYQDNTASDTHNLSVMCGYKNFRLVVGIDGLKEVTCELCRAALLKKIKSLDEEELNV